MQTQSNKNDFNGQNIYAGFDVHLKSWTVTIMTDHLTHKTFVQPPDPEVLHRYLVEHFPDGRYHTAYEAGFCGFWIHHKLIDLGVNSIVTNPADIPTSEKEKIMKTDPRDSRKIARSLRNGDLQPIYIPSMETVQDRGLIRARSLLVKDLSRFKSRIKSFLYQHGIEYPEAFQKASTHWSNRFNKWLESVVFSAPSGKISFDILLTQSKNLRASVLQVTRQIRVLSRTEKYKKQNELLCTIPGIGLITAMLILTEIETINRFSNLDKFCGFIGLIPSTNSSGEKQNVGEITPRGHSYLRTALIESAWVAARTDPELHRCYQVYCQRMEPNKAIVRIARKLVSRIKFVLTNECPYQKSVMKSKNN